MMETLQPIFTTYLVKVEVVTPVHVGMAQEKNYAFGLDFVIDNGVAIFLNISLLLKSLTDTERQSLTAAFARGDTAQSAALLLQLSNMYPHAVQHRKPIEGKFIEGKHTEIKRLYRTGTGQYCIPGSSLKGVIRSVLLAELKKKPGSDLRRVDQQLTEVMGNITNNLMRFVQVGDVCLQPEQIAIRRTKIFSADKDAQNGEHGEWKQKSRGNHTPEFGGDAFATFYEMAVPLTTPLNVPMLTIRLGVQLPHQLGKHAAGLNMETEMKRDNVPNYRTLLQGQDGAWLIGVIKAHTKRYLERERAYFNKFQNDDLDKTKPILTRIDELLAFNNLPDSCLLRVGAGVGFHSITGDWQQGSQDHFSELKKDTTLFAKTRKFAYWGEGDERELALMGFLKLTLTAP